MQWFAREKGGNRGKFIGSNLGIFCYEEFEKVALRNLLANRKPHLLFILRQSEANMWKLFFHDDNIFKM